MGSSFFLLPSSFFLLPSSFLLFFFLFLFFLFFWLFIIISSNSFCRKFILIFRRVRCSCLFTWPLSKPFWQFSFSMLTKFFKLFFPVFLQELTVQNLPATLIELLPVFISPCICSSLILGVHSDLGRVLSCESLWIQAFLHGFLPQLLL